MHAGGETASNGSDEFFRRHRLAEDAGNLEIFQVLGGPRYHDNRNIGGVCVSRDFLPDYDTTDVRQHQIEHDEIRWFRIEAPERVQTDRDVVHVEASQRECGPIKPPEISIVFDHKNRRGRSSHPPIIVTIYSILNLSREPEPLTGQNRLSLGLNSPFFRLAYPADRR